SLAIAGEAYVPLSSGVRTRFVVFRDAFGDDPVAVIVGTPDLSKPVPVRIHSACLTGDVFGSRRCDCGEQLKLALARLQEAAGGRPARAPRPPAAVSPRRRRGPAITSVMSPRRWPRRRKATRRQGWFRETG